MKPVDFLAQEEIRDSLWRQVCRLAYLARLDEIDECTLDDAKNQEHRFEMARIIRLLDAIDAQAKSS